MGYEGSWSGMRKYLEKEMLADCLKGRIRYFCTTYVGMDSCRIFEISIDDNYKNSFRGIPYMQIWAKKDLRTQKELGAK